MTNGATWKVTVADCVEEMRKMPADSIDAAVTDPPYGLEFMGKEWDRLWDGRGGQTQFHHGDIGAVRNKPTYEAGPTAQEWHLRWATEAFRVLKPGAHLLAFGGTRTYHRLACAIEDAGFEVRDTIDWCYGSGFPKSHDAGEGRGTALKPAHEPIVVARKPLTGTIAENIGRFGTGALNIEATRVAVDPARDSRQLRTMNRNVRSTREGAEWGFNADGSDAPEVVKAAGRWPPNILLVHDPGCRKVGEREVPSTHRKYEEGRPVDRNAQVYMQGWAENRVRASRQSKETVEMYDCAPGCPVAELDRQSGVLKSGDAPNGLFRYGASSVIYGGGKGLQPGPGPVGTVYGDEGGFSRFFPQFEWTVEERSVVYCPKAPRAERDAGLDIFEPVTVARAVRADVEPLSDSSADYRERWTATVKNIHPTVKPIALLRWLVRLVTPKGGTVLDPFAGSGSCGCAAIIEGLNYIGIEKEKPYAEIAEARITYWKGIPALRAPGDQLTKREPAVTLRDWTE